MQNLIITILVLLPLGIIIPKIVLIFAQKGLKKGGTLKP